MEQEGVDGRYEVDEDEGEVSGYEDGGKASAGGARMVAPTEASEDKKRKRKEKSKDRKEKVCRCRPIPPPHVADVIPCTLGRRTK